MGSKVTRPCSDTVGGPRKRIVGALTTDVPPPATTSLLDLQARVISEPQISNFKLRNLGQLLVAERTLNPATGAAAMRDKIMQRRVRDARDRFVASIDEGDVLRLASSHHGGDPCAFFRPPARGAYNVCFFVRFEGGGRVGGPRMETAGDRRRTTARKAEA